MGAPPLWIEKCIRCLPLPKIISKCCELMKLCHINRRVPVFCRSGLNVLFTPPNFSCWGFYPRIYGHIVHIPKRHFLARNYAFWALIGPDRTHSATCGLGKENKKKKKNKKQELSQRKQIVRQLRTQLVEGISVTLKSRLRVTQGHWNGTIG